VYVDRRGLGYGLCGFERVGHGGATSSPAAWRPDGILSAIYLVLQTRLQAMQKGLRMGQRDSSRISTEAARLLVKAELGAWFTATFNFAIDECYRPLAMRRVQ
jgi:hypothetical protein